MNKVDYNEKIKEHLDDNETYLKLDSDPTRDLRTTVNQYLKSLLDKKLITNAQYYSLFAKSSTIPLFYALIKIHKIGVPIRPIVSFIDSPSYNVAKFLSKLLTPSTNKSQRKLKNSYDVKERLANQIIPDSFMLVSFDVKSLFTSIPQSFAIECIKSFLENNSDIYERTRLNSSEILKLMEICLEATCFCYNDQIYKQIHGMPMGSPVSVVIAEIVMQHIENLILSNDSFVFQFWFRYVDDIFACLEKNKIEENLNFINSINHNIQFTVEKEVNNEINFLDIFMKRAPNGQLNFKVFRKSTHTDKYLDYNSYHPEEHKNSVIRSLLHRANNLCDRNEKDNEFKHINKVLIDNNYPTSKIKNISRKLRDGNNSRNNTTNESTEYISAPYIKGTSERVGRILNQYNIKLSHKPTKILKNELCHLKDKRKPPDKAGVIYKLSCKECDSVYIGETGRQLKERVQEHRRDVEKRKPLSKVFSHVNDTGHTFDFDDVSILDSCGSAKIRKQLEGVYTVMNSNSLNRAINLNHLYHPIINQNR